ncbi:Uncharacterised protein [Mycobacteroides abscessus subsp. abscessus]|nr:Uncharacterised protein [Mycobacteroides abscessus subsp. abscessus]
MTCDRRGAARSSPRRASLPNADRAIRPARLAISWSRKVRSQAQRAGLCTYATTGASVAKAA